MAIQFIFKPNMIKSSQPCNYYKSKYRQQQVIYKKNSIDNHHLLITEYRKQSKIQFIKIQVITKTSDTYKMLKSGISQKNLDKIQLKQDGIQLDIKSLSSFFEQANKFKLKGNEIQFINDQNRKLVVSLTQGVISKDNINMIQTDYLLEKIKQLQSKQQYKKSRNQFKKEILRQVNKDINKIHDELTNFEQRQITVQGQLAKIQKKINDKSQNQGKDENVEKINQTYQELEKIKNEINEIIDSKPWEKILNEGSFKAQLQNLKRSYDQKFTNISLELQSKQNKKQKMQSLKQCQILNMIDARSKSLAKFKISGSIVQKIQNDLQWYQLLGSSTIAQKPVNTFIIQKSQMNLLYFGIVDRKYFEDTNSIRQARNQCIAYSVWNGKLLLNSKEKANGGKSCQGDVVTMSVRGDAIQWKVGDKMKMHYRDKIISDNQIQWVPFCIMYSRGDRIKWQ